MFDALIRDLSERYGLGDRSQELFGLLVAYIFNDRRGGFPGFLEGFREQGHGDLASSWIGNSGEPRALNAGDVNMVFGQGLLAEWGNRLGVSRATVAAAIADVLPRLVAGLTPGGRMPGNVGISTPLAATSATVPMPLQPPIEEEVAPAPPVQETASPVMDFNESPATEQAHDFAAIRHEPRPDPAGSGLRREPPAAMRIDDAVRTPVAARQAQQQREASMDPAEQRIAEMMAAMSGASTVSDEPRKPSQGGKPDNWRPAVHRPVKKRRGLGWLWFLLLLVAIAAGLAYAWQLGALDPLIEQVNPYIRQFDLWIPTRQPAQ